jgi:hypothetical protein
VREAHKRIDPDLVPVEGDPDHLVACLLTTETRRRLWEKLRAGAGPDEAREAVPLLSKEA